MPTTLWREERQQEKVSPAGTPQYKNRFWLARAKALQHSLEAGKQNQEKKERKKFNILKYTAYAGYYQR